MRTELCLSCLLLLIVGHGLLQEWSTRPEPPDESTMSDPPRPVKARCPFRLIKDPAITLLGKFRTVRSSLPIDPESITPGQWVSQRVRVTKYTCQWGYPTIVHVAVRHVVPSLKDLKNLQQVNMDGETQITSLPCPWYPWSGTHIMKQESVIRENKSVRFHIGSSSYFDFDFPLWTCKLPPCVTTNPAGMWIPNGGYPSQCSSWHEIELELLGVTRADPETYHVVGMYSYPVPLRKSCTCTTCSRNVIVLPTGDLLEIPLAPQISKILSSYPRCSISIHRKTGLHFDPRGLPSELLDLENYYRCTLTHLTYILRPPPPQLLIPLLQSDSAFSLIKYQLNNGYLSPSLSSVGVKGGDSQPTHSQILTLHIVGALLHSHADQNIFTRYDYNTNWSMIDDIIREMDQTVEDLTAQTDPEKTQHPLNRQNEPIFKFEHIMYLVMLISGLLITFSTFFVISKKEQTSEVLTGNNSSTSSTGKRRKVKRTPEVWSNPSRRIKWNCKTSCSCTHASPTKFMRVPSRSLASGKSSSS
ncbi:glycoprotein [Huangpi Tick Virus 3]|uniref:Glycoprotein n=1 Tax=Huangpi Tick Virus 3 TaxID=1608049 RepID=A0A0B5KRE8_9RHAB|nr:glycoprotein [Huangpi Tick Virus 3]AJG39106.1 glycoprotein [Huangpi Tick Virus 3]